MTTFPALSNLFKDAVSSNGLAPLTRGLVCNDASRLLLATDPTGLEGLPPGCSAIHNAVRRVFPLHVVHAVAGIAVGRLVPQSFRRISAPVNH